MDHEEAKYSEEQIAQAEVSSKPGAAHVQDSLPMNRRLTTFGLVVLGVALYAGWASHRSCIPSARILSGFTLKGPVTEVACTWNGSDQVTILLQLDSAAALQASVEAARTPGFKRFEDLLTARDSALFPDLVGRHGWVSDTVYRNLGGNRVVLDLDQRILKIRHADR